MKYLAICDYDGTISSKNGISNKTKKMINEFCKDNLLYIISYEKFDILNKEFNIKNTNFNYISLSDNKWYINNKIIYKNINSNILNEIITKFHNYIYTMFTTSNDISYIYNYQERLNLLYPKNNQIINEFIYDASGINITISNEAALQLKNYLSSNNLYYDEYAKDKNREILIISSLPNTKEDITKMLINQNRNLISIGIADDINDYKYLKHCNIKIAMLNSNDQLKSLCDDITDYDNLNDGCMLKLLSIYNS